MENQLATTQQNNNSLAVYANAENFALAQRIANSLASSQIVPKEYQGNTANTMVALEMANRIGVSPLAVMQNLHIIHGKPSWSATFIISAINTCGRFEPLQFAFEENGTVPVGNTKIKNTVCVAYSYDRKGNRVEGGEVSVSMAVNQGWWGKSGSKWPVMTKQMLMYRAAAFFGRIYCPEILMGMKTQDEIIDIDDQDYHEVASEQPQPSPIEQINNATKVKNPEPAAPESTKKETVAPPPPPQPPTEVVEPSATQAVEDNDEDDEELL